MAGSPKRRLPLPQWRPPPPPMPQWRHHRATPGPQLRVLGAPDAIDMGTVRKAMAMRVKYRVLTDSGQVKRRLSLRLLGVHPDNRGGIYPQGDVVKTLGIRLAGLGYNQDEADHQGVAVQEIPVEHQHSAVAESYGQYNIRKCLGQPLLQSCFGVESNVAFGMLSQPLASPLVVLGQLCQVGIG